MGPWVGSDSGCLGPDYLPNEVSNARQICDGGHEDRQVATHLDAYSYWGGGCLLSTLRTQNAMAVVVRGHTHRAAYFPGNIVKWDPPPFVPLHSSPISALCFPSFFVASGEGSDSSFCCSTRRTRR